MLPDTSTIHATEEGMLPISDLLSKAAKKTMILPNLHSSSLISLGQLCDDNCTVILTKQQLLILKKGNIILTGLRNATDGLWDIPINKNILPHQRQQIPVHKTEVHENQYITPKTHPALYNKQKRVSQITTKVTPGITKPKQGTKKAKKVLKIKKRLVGWTIIFPLAPWIILFDRLRNEMK